MSDPFCSVCDVSLDLHDGPDSCRSAEVKARVLDMFQGVLEEVRLAKD